MRGEWWWVIKDDDEEKRVVVRCDEWCWMMMRCVRCGLGSIVFALEESAQLT